jgi:hypothetical protein
MAMTLRLNDEDTAALRVKAAEEEVSMHEVIVRAVRLYTSDRKVRLRAAIERVVTEDAELLERLSR